MATFSEIIDRASKNVLDPSQDTLTRMAEWVNEAQRELEDAHQFRVMEAALTADTVAGTRTLVSKPATWMEEIDAPFYTEKDGNSTPLVWLDESAEMRAVYDYDDPLDKGAPEVLVERETGIEVLPAPDGLGKTGTNLASLAAGEYRITIPYKARLGVLTTAAETNWFSLNADKFLEFRATAEAFMFDRDEQRGMLWGVWQPNPSSGSPVLTGLAGAQLQRLISRDKRSRISGKFQWTPQSGAKPGRVRRVFGGN